MWMVLTRTTPMPLRFSPEQRWRGVVPLLRFDFLIVSDWPELLITSRTTLSLDLPKTSFSSVCTGSIWTPPSTENPNKANSYAVAH